MNITEKAVKPIIEEYFNIKLNNTPIYHEYDFISEDCISYFELKGRNVKHNHYRDTMIGYNKIEKIKELNKKSKIYFVFKFTDGIYYCRYNKKIKNNSIIKKGGRCDRGRPEFKKYLFIPINLLKQIC